jgi:hypothetical protein
MEKISSLREIYAKSKPVSQNFVDRLMRAHGEIRRVHGIDLPSFLQRIPMLACCAGSGDYIPQVRWVGGLKLSEFGGLDVFRRDPDDEPLGFPFNMDSYRLIQDPWERYPFLALGPLVISDNHWFSSLPERITTAVSLENSSDLYGLSTVDYGLNDVDNQA